MVRAAQAALRDEGQPHAGRGGVDGRLVDGIDVASAGELKVALDAGADPAEVSFAGPGKRDPNWCRPWPPGCW
jgi:hypothetical protein